MSKNADETAERVAALERQLAEFKAAMPKPAQSWEEQERARREWDNEVHQMREANANRVPPWLQRECAGGVSDADAQDLVRASHAPTGPSSQGAIPSSQQVSNVRGAPWRWQRLGDANPIIESARRELGRCHRHRRRRQAAQG